MSRACRLLCAGLLAVLCAAGCARETLPVKLFSITGHMPRLEFEMVDHTGRAVGGEDFRGKVVLLYFGYTHCPDVCPLTLAQLHGIMRELGEDAEAARILFVSVDPARDDPDTMRAYVEAFDPRAVGLTGSARATEALAKRYRTAFSRDPAPARPEAGGYEVSHSASIFLFDREGRPRLIAVPAAPREDILHDLRLLIDEEQA